MRPHDLIVPAGEARESTAAEVRRAESDDPELVLISDYLMRALDPLAEEDVARRLQEDEKFRARVSPIMDVWSAWPTVRDFEVNEKELSESWQRFLVKAAWREEAPVAGGHEPRDSRWDGGTRTGGSADSRSRHLQRRLRRWQLASLLLLAVGVSSAAIAGVAWGPRLTGARLLEVEASSREPKLTPVGDNGWVTLYPGSHITWRSKATEDGVREMVLDGSARFRLQPMGAGRYVVVTPAARVMVTGTEFTVEVTDPSTTVVSVATGGVLVSARGPRAYESLAIGPGERAVATWGQPPRRVR